MEDSIVSNIYGVGAEPKQEDEGRELLLRSIEFYRHVPERYGLLVSKNLALPTENRLHFFAIDDDECWMAEVSRLARTASFVIPREIYDVISLQCMEKTNAYCKHLLQDRPIAWFGDYDFWQVLSATTHPLSSHTHTNGDSQPKLLLQFGMQNLQYGAYTIPSHITIQDNVATMAMKKRQTSEEELYVKYLTYPEILHSAFIAVASETYFINDGNRFNKGKIDPEIYKQKIKGVYVGCVGPRFENLDEMDSILMVVTDKKDNNDNKQRKELVRHQFAKALGCHEVTYEELEEAANSRSDFECKGHDYSKIPQNNQFLDCTVYKRRIELTIRLFLDYTVSYLEKQGTGQRAWISCTALGLGVWALHADKQKQIMADVYAELIPKYASHLHTVEFGWFDGKDFENDVCVKGHFETRLSDKLPRPMSTDTTDIKFTCGGLLTEYIKYVDETAETADGKPKPHFVAMYAWDGGAYPGNEYWVGDLDGSGDPAAACCSHISELQNVLINEHLRNSEVCVFPTGSDADDVHMNTEEDV